MTIPNIDRCLQNNLILLRVDVGNIVKLVMVNYKCSLTTISKTPFFAIDNDTTKTKKTKNLFRV